jgi:chromosome partitioning protein
MDILLVANPKGGSGKTTLATNLAGYLAGRERRVVLCDLDRQKSALEWLSIRPRSAPPIARLRADASDGIDPPRHADWMVIDSPAGLHGRNLAHALKPARKVLVPLQPSLFDMATTRDFLAVLAEERAVRKHKTFVGIVGMRVAPRTRAAATLEAFLRQYELPVLACLRDTQVYPNAAFQGLSVFDLPPYLGERDCEQWQPIARWIEE